MFINFWHSIKHAFEITVVQWIPLKKTTDKEINRFKKTIFGWE